MRKEPRRLFGWRRRRSRGCGPPASRLPLFEERDGKLYLADGGSLPHTYRGFFDVIADDSSFVLYVKCRVGGCDSKAMIPVTHNGKVNFSNASRRRLRTRRTRAGR